jgi:spore cortex formation protein SpoVR/YcgB (stage V sporulation)
MSKNKPFYTGSEWNFEFIEKSLELCEEIAKEELNLDTYPNVIEIVTSEQMLDAYASNGMPIFYNHWSFGKKFLVHQKEFRKGMPLAYEMVINSNPCINYLMENNTATTQLLVIAHAAFGHNHFFKNNYLFREQTHADFILQYLTFAKDYIRKCEEKYGDEVEELLDKCHSLMFMGINKIKKKKTNVQKEHYILQQKIKLLEENYDHFMEKTTDWMIKKEKEKNKNENLEEKFTKHLDEENILYVIEKNSLVLKDWQKEIVRIVRKIAEYFYPQILTKVMNEGFACFVHYYIMYRLWEKGLITDGSMLEFIDLHTAVVNQPDLGVLNPNFNPYYLGFHMFMEIKRICENPTEEDSEYFPYLTGKNWKDVILNTVKNYRDDSFIQQFLTPKFIRDNKLIKIHDDSSKNSYLVEKIHNERGYREIRKTLANNYSPIMFFPDIFVKNIKLVGDRVMTLQYNMYNNMDLSKESYMALSNLKDLWGFPIEIIFVDENDVVKKRKKIS